MDQSAARNIGSFSPSFICRVKRHLTGEFRRAYVPTHGAEVTRIPFHTTHGTINFDIW